MANFIKNTAVYSLSNFIPKVINFVLLPVYTTVLLPDQFGIVNSMEVFSSIIMIFFTLSLERSIYRLYFDHKDEAKKKVFLGTVFITILIVSLILTSILFLFSGFSKYIFEKIAFYPYFSVVILNTFFSVFLLIPKILFQVKENPKTYFYISIGTMVLKVLTTLTLIITFRSAESYLYGLLIGSIISLFYLLPITFKNISLKFDFKIFKEILNYSLPLVPTLVSAWIVNMTDRIFIERFYDLSDVGIYSLAYKIGQVVQFISVSILMAYNPFFFKTANSNSTTNNGYQKLKKITNFSVIFMMISGFLIAVFSKDLIVLFLNPKYLQSYLYVPIIVLGYFFIQLISFLNLSFYQEKKTSLLMKINIVAAFVNVGLNYFLISNYGLFGAAFSTLITQFVLFLIVYNFSKKLYFIPYNWNIIIPIGILFLIIISLNIIVVEATIMNFIIKSIAVISLGFLIYFKKKSEIINLKNVLK